MRCVGLAICNVNHNNLFCAYLQSSYLNFYASTDMVRSCWKSKYGTTLNQQDKKQAIKDLEAKLHQVTQERAIIKSGTPPEAMTYMSQEGLK